MDDIIPNTGRNYGMNKHPAITRDRECPEWFMNELNKIDPLLKVEYWNDRGSFRLVRVLPDGRWAGVAWFKVADSLFLEVLREADNFGKENEPGSKEAKAARIRELRADMEKRDDAVMNKHRNTYDDLATSVAAEAEKGQVLYSYKGKKLGSGSEVDWNR